MACLPLSHPTKYQSEQLFLGAGADLQNGMEPREGLTSLGFAAERSLVGCHLLNQARDPIQGLLVGDMDCNALVVRNLAIKLAAFSAHWLTARSGGSVKHSQSR